MRQGKILAGTVLGLMLVAGSASASVSAAEEKVEESNNPWRGSAVTYGHSVSAISLYKAAEQTWNPYYAHSLSLQPQWHFGKDFLARARFAFEQELTNSDDSRLEREYVWSDLRLDAVYKGYSEAITGIKVAGDLRFVLPTSKAAHAATLILGVAPAVSVSRKFDLMKGLNVGYSARHQWNFHSETTARYDGAGFPCREDGAECAMYLNTGVGNSRRTLQHGPMVSFSPIDKLDISMVASLYRTRLYDFESTTVAPQGGDIELGESSEYQVRYANFFSVEVGYQLLDYLGVAVSAVTFNPQLKPDGTYRRPFFNRYTAFTLDLNLDLDALYSKL